MATQIIGQIWLGSGAPGTPGNVVQSNYAQISMSTTPLVNGSGNDGDIYVLKAGGNSTLFIQRSGIWVSLINMPIFVTLPDNTSNFVWFSVLSSATKYITIDYSITRGVNMKMGKLSAITDGLSAAINEYGIVALNADTGTSFDASISGTNFQLLSNTTNQGVSATLEYFIRSWS